MRRTLSAAFLSLILLVLATGPNLPATATPAIPQLKSGVPLYRVFRGFRRADITHEAFVQDLQTRFIPAVARTHAKNGLVAYLPALPPEPHPPTLPDEVAIILYESEPVYQQAKATPEGQAYSALHWEIFDKQRSRSVTAVSLESTQSQLQADVGYDLMQLPTDWQQGHSTFFIGWRQRGVPVADFLPRLTAHVKHVKTAFSPYGLNGYVVIATPDYEIAYMHWQDQAGAEAAFASAPGQQVIDEAQALLESLQWSPTTGFSGRIQPGQAVNIKFKRRAPNP